MAFLQWRRFNFFVKETVKDPEDNQPFSKLKDISVTCCTSGRGQIVLGDVEGNVHFLNRQLQHTTFRAYDLQVSHLQQLVQHNILVSAGEDERGAVNPLVKLWNLEKMDRSGRPLCTRIIRAISGVNPSPVTALAVSENLNFMAIGFDDGNVLLYRGDIQRERHSRHRMITTGRSSISGLAFRSIDSQTFLYVASTDEVMSYNITAKDKELEKNLLDSHGCLPRRCVMSDAKQDNQFVIGREEAVYFYQPDGRGPCLAFDGEKLILHWFRGYLVVVGKEKPPPQQQHQQPMSTSQAEMNKSQSETNIVTIYDVHNKFIAYSAPIQNVVDVISEWGSLFVLGSDGKLYALQERDTQSKLEMLFKKNQYSLAISLAKSQQYDEDGLADIFRQYGDHLYKKGDHDGAIAQYIKTIGKLEASYVIMKFLDAQRIHNLTAYLQALHKKGLATEDHTTLLLNCYTKLKDSGRLEEFIMTKDREVDFDDEIAIKVCRQAGYYTYALHLAEKHNRHEWYLKIQLEDLKDCKQALNYISKLDFHHVESNLKKYGKILINEEPDSTTELLKRLCTDYKACNAPLVEPNMLEGAPPPEVQKAEPEEFIHIFVNNSNKLLEFLEHMVKMHPLTSSNIVYNTLLELYLQSYNHEKDTSEKEAKEKRIMDMLADTEAKYDIDQAMVLCQMNNFRPGILHLYEKAQLYQQILSYHMEYKDYKKVLKTCEKFGTCDPNLWVQALWFFSTTDDDQRHYLEKVLTQIEKRKLLPPIMVVDIMAKSNVAKLAVIKDYLIRHLRHANENLSHDEQLIKQYREETAKMRSQIEEIRTCAKSFQVSKCSGCTHPLELPSVHFLCGHSFHQQCFEGLNAENDTECPKCEPENRKVLDTIKNQESNKDLHEQFHLQLERAEDTFSVVAEYFGKGVFSKTTLFAD